MAVFKFTPHNDVRRAIKFDGSPSFSITKSYGWYEKQHLVLELSSSHGFTQTYDVYGFYYQDSEERKHLGTLEYSKPLWAGGPSCSNSDKRYNTRSR